MKKTNVFLKKATPFTLNAPLFVDFCRACGQIEFWINISKAVGDIKFFYQHPVTQKRFLYYILKTKQHM